ncbi:MAG: hypothetical protein HOC71_06455 [Candidatus Latescibacteria bacterium]|jgi:hypothetical protein|nr:hypothetical protein [Candidatus Latescibacterota bacterium]
MKKVLTLIVLSLFVVSVSFAGTPTNKAIGFNGGLNGISHRMLMDSGIGVEGILGLAYNAPAGDTQDAALNLNIGANVLKCLWETEAGSLSGNLNGFAGVGIAMVGSNIKDSDSVTNITINVGLEPEIFLLDNLSVTTRMGLQILLNGDTLGADGKAATDTGSTVFQTFGQGVSIVNGVSFNWYF